MKTSNAYLQIHICVVLWGFTAVFGRLISLPALPLVWWRMLLVSVILAFVPRVWRGVRAMPPRLIAAYAGIGVVIALHWLTFYGSIKLSNASVGATCMALAPVFLAFIEPLIVRRRFDIRELLLGIAMIPGVILVVGGVPPGMRVGIAVGALSALLVALFGTLNKVLVHRGDPIAVTAIELTAGAALLTVITAVMPGSGSAFVIPSTRDAIYLLVLAVGCTIVPFTLALVALRQLSAFATQLAVNLEPVYAILLASLLLGEHHDLGLSFYAGVAIILGLVLLYPLIIRRTPPVPSSHHDVYADTCFRVGGASQFPARFAIITAYPTTGETWPEAEIAAAQDALRAELAESGVWMLPVTGYSPNSGHAEPGWGVEMPVDDALALARKYKQVAIFYVTGDALSVVYCDDRSPTPLGSFRSRLRPATTGIV